MSNTRSLSRRNFLRLAAVAAAIPATLISERALAADLPHLTPDDPTAKSLAYTPDASKIDAKAEPTYKAGSACASCMLFGGKAGDTFGPCALFPGKAVSATGWCKGYSKKA